MSKPTFKSQTAKKFTSSTEPDSGIEIKYSAPAAIQTAEPFISLFAIQEGTFAAIVESMKESGFDEMQPVIIWKEQNILIDGHTRRLAAIDAGIEQIPYMEKSFASEEAAIDYMYSLQFRRRSITDSELLPLAIRALEQYEKKYGEGSKAEFLVKRFPGLSLGKAKKLSIVATIITADDEKAVAEIIAGTQTINSVYESIQASKKEKTPKKEKVQSNFSGDGDAAGSQPWTEFNPELCTIEGNKICYSVDGKLQTIAVVATSHSSDAAFMAEILTTVKQHFLGGL